MARLTRAEVFDPKAIAILHICARVVRRCFLFGIDPFTGKFLSQSEPSEPSSSQRVDSFLSPLTIDEKHDPLGARANETRERCSDKGFLSMPIADYLESLDASGKVIRPDKSGYIPADVAPIFERLKLDHKYWLLQIKDFGRLFANVAGKPKDVYEMRSLISKRRFYLKRFKPESTQAT